jgi:D-glycero-D-manno-heptose 1,7-bisphosphate phosphatase
MTGVVYRRARITGGALRVPAIFLDRDGVIVEDVGYLHRTSDIRYIDGALAAVASLHAMGSPVVLITNQSGIGRGMYGWKRFERVQQQIDRDLARLGARLDGVWACAAHPQGRGEFAHPSHPFRKPNAGMLYDAAERMHLELSRSWLVGDKPSDVEAGLRGGLAGICHVATGYGAVTRAEADRLPRLYGSGRCEYFSCASIAEAAQHIREQLERE